jgi:hypothetical protein
MLSDRESANVLENEWRHSSQLERRKFQMSYVPKTTRRSRKRLNGSNRISNDAFTAKCGSKTSVRLKIVAK